MTFEQNIKNSFSAARQDADTIRSDIAAFKDNMSGWLQYFEQSNKEMAAKIVLLERRIAELESEKVAKKITNSLELEKVYTV